MIRFFGSGTSVVKLLDNDIVIVKMIDGLFTVKSVSLGLIIVALVFAISAVCLAAEVEDYSITINVFKESPAVVKFFENSYGYAVFPTIEKAGFVIGGSYGKGQVYRNGKVTGITKVFLSFPRIAWERAYKPKHDNSPYVMCV